MIRSLYEAARAGEPLIDVVVCFVDGVDYAVATETANSLGPDFELRTSDYYGDPRLRIGSITSEGALRLFGVKIRRVRLEKWDQQRQQYDGLHSDVFRWDMTPIERWPDTLVPYVKSIGMTQPGADDDGQAYTPQFDR